MNTQTANPLPPLTWVLLDRNPGHRRQALAIADALGWCYETRDLNYGLMARLPNAVLGARLYGLTTEARRTLHAPWPDLVIAAGRRTAPVAKAIRFAAGGHSRLVQVMDPGGRCADVFSLIVIPQHDKVSRACTDSANSMYTLGAPHGVNCAFLAESKQAWASVLGPLSSPRIAVFVGGGTRRRRFDRTTARNLAALLRERKRESGGSLIVTTSARSGIVAEILADALGDDCDHFHRWGSMAENPYGGYLAWADRIIVTGDSVSMCSEACATGAPVGIFAPDVLTTPKHARFHKMLYGAGLAAPVGAGDMTPPAQTLDVAGDVASRVRDMFR